MVVELVRAGLEVKGEAVSAQGRDECAGGKAAELSVVDRHTLNGNGDVRLIRNLDLPLWAFGYRLTMLPQAFDHEPDTSSMLRKAFSRVVPQVDAP